MPLNAMGRIQARRAPTAGPEFERFDERVGGASPSNPLTRGLVLLPGIGENPQADNGRMALTALAVLVVALAGFNVWTHAYQK